VWSLLERLPEDQAEQVLKVARRRTFATGEVLLNEADPADTLHVIVKGRVAFLGTTEAGDQVMFSVSGPGEFFGELGLIMPDRIRTLTAQALEPTETLSIQRADFDRLRRESSQLTDLLLGLLAERVQSLSNRLQEALFVPADVRVLRRLLAVAAVYGAGSKPTTVPLSQEQLASLAGTSRATVNRVLREEQERGSMRLGRQRATILDEAALSRRAGL
jgi:CRP/FNR family transcriptional regulator, cyclic AMP receptor protein